MDTLWPTLVQFILRLSFGLTLAMCLTPAKWVTSGFFRVHLWVVMGFATVASLALYSNWPWYAKHIASSPAIPFALTISLAFVCYFGAVIWMYEQARLGKIAITLATLLSCSAGWLSMGTGHEPAPLWSLLLIAVDWLASGFTLGFFIASMFLGHWYLNWPGMKLEPLKRLIMLAAGSLILRALLSLCGLWIAFTYVTSPSAPVVSLPWSFIIFRWLAGIIGPAVMTYMTWQTLKIPNTQSATGILYAAVILTFLGELTSQLLSRSLLVPV